MESAFMTIPMPRVVESKFWEPRKHSMLAKTSCFDFGFQPVIPLRVQRHICLSILYDAWSPALTVHAVCMSIVSMLSSAQEKVRPKDDASYVARVGHRSPKLSKWHFDDDRV
mmetsp:Transcript_526/g.720  ORF Transcript_526/g.720 Transcript_526/m.720 type:complete len:112 (-) Transcript_526:32-367(-)